MTTILTLAFVSLFTGLGVFMAGVIFMRQALNTLIQGRLKGMVAHIGHNRYIAASSGAVAAACMQSSGAVSVVAISAVDSGGLTLFGASAVILGANVGTTLLGLTVASSHLPISSMLGVLTLIGSFVILSFNKPIATTIGQAIIGLGLIFVGMKTMSNAFGQAEMSRLLGGFFSQITYAPMLMLLAALCAALLQSSSAIVALAISMVATNTISLYFAFFVVLGADVGTCIVSILACIGTSKDAKRVAMLQLLFNIMGAVIFCTGLMVFKKPIMEYISTFHHAPSMVVALFHIMFNLVCVVIALPLLKYLVGMTKFFVRD